MATPKMRWKTHCKLTSQGWDPVDKMLKDTEFISDAAMHKALDVIFAVLEDGLPGSPGFGWQHCLDDDTNKLAISFSYGGGPQGTRVATCVIFADAYCNGIGISERWASEVDVASIGWYPEAVVPSLVMYMLGMRPRNDRYGMFGRVR